MESLGFPVSNATSSANRDSLMSPLQVWNLFCFLSVDYGRTSSAERGLPWLVPALRGDDFRFSPLKMMSAAGLPSGLYSVDRHFLKTHYAFDVVFCQMLFLQLLRGSYAFVLSLVFVFKILFIYP